MHGIDCADYINAGEVHGFAASERKKRPKGRDIAKVCYLGIQQMDDDIAYRKDDI